MRDIEIYNYDSNQIILGFKEILRLQGIVNLMIAIILIMMVVM